MQHPRSLLEPLAQMLRPPRFNQGTVSHPGDPALKVPMGRGAPTGVKRSALLYNEYVVYDTRQIKQKYVLKVHFKHR